MEFAEVRKIRQKLYWELLTKEPFKRYLAGYCIVPGTREGELFIKVDLTQPLPEGVRLPEKYKGVRIIIEVIGKTEEQKREQKSGEKG